MQQDQRKKVMFQLPSPPSVMCPISSQIERDEEVEEVWSGDSVEEEEVTNDSPIKEGGDGKAAIENSDDTVEEPKMGMEFDSPNDAYLYYSKFAKEKGFAVAKRTSKKGKDGVLIHVVYECSKGGKARVRGSNLAKPRPQSKTECPAHLNICLTQERKWRVSRVILDHNHEQSPGKSRFFKSNRVLDSSTKRILVMNDKAGIRLNKSIDSLQIEAGGPDKVPYLPRDCWNYLDKVRRLQLTEGDAEAMNQYFMRMQADNRDFFYAVDVNEEGRLRNVFWAAARSRAACMEFGDVVTFDTTYLVNRYDMPFAPFVGVNHHGSSVLLGCGLISHEDTESFAWLFKNWLTCMSGRAPNAIITDQCAAMRNAIENIFPNTRHRWCIWHIMKKVPKKLKGYEAYEKISYRFRSAVYDSLTVEEFETAWDALIKKYELQSNTWLHGLYLEKERWVPAFVKDVFWAGMSSTQRSESMNAYFDGYISSTTTLKQFVEQYENALTKKMENEKQEYHTSWHTFIPCITNDGLEKQFQSAYTHTKFREFHVQYCGKMVCSLGETIEGDVVTLYEVKELITVGEGEDQFQKCVPFKIHFNGETTETHCNCRLFESKGMVCKHQLFVYQLRGIHKVPEKYVLRRWCKNVKRTHTKVRISYDKSAKTIEARRNDNVCNLYKEIADLVEDNEERYNVVMAQGHEFKRQFTETQAIETQAIETQVVCASNMVDDRVGSFSFGDGVIPSKQSTTILDPKSVTRKGRPPCKRKQSIVEKAVKKKREAVKKKTLTAGKAAVSNEQVKEIGDNAVVNVATTQDSVLNVNNYAHMGPLMWPNMGPLMWPNMMAHNFQNPPNLMPTMQSAIRGGPQGWGTPHSSLMGSQLQEWQGVQPSFLGMMNGMNNKKE